MDRRKEREFALKVLYASEYNDMDLGEQFNHLMQAEQRHASPFAKDIVTKCTAAKEEINALIKSKLKHWRFERVAVIDRVLLRMAITEFLYFDDIPPSVTMDEIIEISKMYSTDKSDGFINGILDAVLKQLKSENRIKKSGRGLVPGLVH